MKAEEFIAKQLATNPHVFPCGHVDTGEAGCGGCADEREALCPTVIAYAEDTMTWQDKLKRLRNKVLVKLEPLRRIGRSVR